MKVFFVLLMGSIVVFLGFQNCSGSNLNTLNTNSPSSKTNLSMEMDSPAEDELPITLESGELFSELVLKYNSTTYQDYRSRSFLSFDNKELHISFEPKANEVIDEMPPEHHSILQTISTLIANVPSGQSVHFAFFNLNEKTISKKIISAIERGVRVRIVLSNLQNISHEKGQEDDDYGDSPQALEIKEALEAAIKNANSDQNSLIICKKGDDAGSCIDGSSKSKNHNKFVIFSEVCKNGLDKATKKCKNNSSYERVSVQTSLNFSSSQRRKFNTLSLFYGNSELYQAYLNYHKSLERHELKNSSSVIRMEDGSEITFNALPQSQKDYEKQLERISMSPQEMNSKTTSPDIMISPMFETNCPSAEDSEGKVIPTKIRVSNAHWLASDPGEGAKRGDYMISALSELKRRGCDVRILGPKDLTPDGDNKNTFNKIFMADLNIRSFSKNTNANNHTKFITIHEPTINGVSGKRILMFGSMSITHTAHNVNDETWLVWRNPSRYSMRLYNDAFDQLFSDLKTFKDEFKLVDFKCRVSEQNSGCVGSVECPDGLKVFSAKAACNLEYGGVKNEIIDNLLPNQLLVNEASGYANEGVCQLERFKISVGKTNIQPDQSKSNIKYSCVEHDVNGGDCAIKGQLICY